MTTIHLKSLQVLDRICQRKFMMNSTARRSKVEYFILLLILEIWAGAGHYIVTNMT